MYEEENSHGNHKLFRSEKEVRSECKVYVKARKLNKVSIMLRVDSI